MTELLDDYSVCLVTVVEQRDGHGEMGRFVVAGRIVEAGFVSHNKASAFSLAHRKKHGGPMAVFVA